MAEDERAEIFNVLADLTQATLDAFPEVRLVAPKTLPTIVSGFKSYSQKSMPGLYLDTEKDGFSVTIFVSVSGKESMVKLAKRLQKNLFETFSDAFPGKIRAVDIEIWKTTRS